MYFKEATINFSIAYLHWHVHWDNNSLKARMVVVKNTGNSDREAWAKFKINKIAITNALYCLGDQSRDAIAQRPKVKSNTAYLKYKIK